MEKTIAKIVRNIVEEVNHANRCIYIDRLKDGASSVKVQGLDSDKYDVLEQRLVDAGFTVKRVQTPRTKHRPSQTRLHVK